MSPFSREPVDAFPDGVPVLARGKHRSARKGACFMEYASWLAGEKWSDHPDCTHPLLASLARMVNDHTTDAGRGRIAPMVPSVIGLTSDDPHVDIRIALRAATTALPVVAEERQRVMAVSVLAAERVLDRLDGREPGTLEARSREALAAAPGAAAWACKFALPMRTRTRGFLRDAAPAAVVYAVDGIARAAIWDPDAMLHDLLRDTLAEVEEMLRPPVSQPARVPVRS